MMTRRETRENVLMALTVADWFVKHFEWRAENDFENSLVWSCAADVAREFADNMDHILDELAEADENGI